MDTKCYERYSINNLYNVIMAWPRTGIIILNNTTQPATSVCLVPAPSASCTTVGSGSSGGSGGGGASNTIVASILNTNMNVGYFKINLESTKTNLYGEAIEKWYYGGVNVRCSIDRGTITNADDDFGVNVSNTITVTMATDLLISYNFMPEVGDIVFDREKYYEVSSIDSQFITLPGTGVSNGILGTTGQIMTYVLTCYLTRITKLNIIPYYQ